jgi:hypothetical protein
MNRLAGLLMLVLVSGCGESAPAPAVERDATDVRDEDGILFRIVLEDLRALAEFHTYPPWSGRPELVVWDTTEGLSAFITTGQLSSELTDQPPVSMELYNNLKARNNRKITLNPIEGKGVRMGPRVEVRIREARTETFEKTYPQARGYVSFWLPAYSEDGITALVRFGFGPTAHSACGTYFLEKKGGSWKILWRKLSYFA